MGTVDQDGNYEANENFLGEISGHDIAENNGTLNAQNDSDTENDSDKPREAESQVDGLIPLLIGTGVSLVTAAATAVAGSSTSSGSGRPTSGSSGQGGSVVNPVGLSRKREGEGSDGDSIASGEGSGGDSSDGQNPVDNFYNPEVADSYRAFDANGKPFTLTVNPEAVAKQDENNPNKPFQINQEGVVFINPNFTGNKNDIQNFISNASMGPHTFSGFDSDGGMVASAIASETRGGTKTGAVLSDSEISEMKRLKAKMNNNTATIQDRENFHKLFDKTNASIEIHGNRNPEDFSFLDGVENPLEAIALIREKYGAEVADAYAKGVDNQKIGNFWRGLADTTIFSPLTAFDWMMHSPKDANPQPVEKDYKLPEEMNGKTEVEKEAYIKGRKLEDKKGISNTIGMTIGISTMIAGGFVLSSLIAGSLGGTSILSAIKNKLSNTKKIERTVFKEVSDKKTILNAADDALPDPNKARINPVSDDALPNKRPTSNLSSADNTTDRTKSPINDNLPNGTNYKEPIFKKIPDNGFDDLKNAIKKQYGDVDFARLKIAPIGESGAFKDVFQFKGIKELEGKVLAIGDGLEANLNSYKEIAKIAKERPDLNIRIPGGLTKVVEVVHPETGKKAMGYFMDKVPNGVESKEIFDFYNSLRRLKGEAKDRAIKDMLKLREFAKNYDIVDIQGILDSKSGKFYLTDAMGIRKYSTIIQKSPELTRINSWLGELGVKVKE